MYRGAELTIEPPFFITRFFHTGLQQGGATFGFEPGSPVSEESMELLRALKMPFNIYITSQYRYWELDQRNRMIEEDNARLRKQAMGLGETDIIGANGGLRQVADMLRQVAPLDISLLIQGETGTGKEVVERPVPRDVRQLMRIADRGGDAARQYAAFEFKRRDHGERF